MKSRVLVRSLTLTAWLGLLPGGAAGESSYRPGATFQQCGDCPAMVVVPAGSFMMGSRDGFSSERPVHEVTISKPFALGKYEVTFAQWDACVSGGGCDGYRPYDVGWGRGQRPVVNVSWEDAQHYVEWLSGRTGKEYRLPSESEWEYGARAGTTGSYSWGNRASPTRANYGTRKEKTVPVGSYPANGFGLYDMHGNVSEWTQDCWNEDYEGAPTDGSVWESGNCNRRVLRGGSWGDEALGGLRSAVRSWSATAIRNYVYGFRVARTLD